MENKIKTKYNEAVELFHEAKSNFEENYKKRNIRKIKKGLRHGQGIFHDFFDRLSSFNYEGPNVIEAMEGKGNPPKNYYGVGRYMSLADSFLSNASINGDMDMALAGANIYRLLGQTQRKSVKRKIKKAYNQAKEISSKYEIPIYTKENRVYSITSEKIGRGIERFVF